MSEHTLSERTYYLVFAALIVLTAATVGVGFVPLGSWHLVVGLGFGACKALLVVLFFMHVLHSSRLTLVMILAALFWLAILVGLTLSDYLTRQWLAY